MRALLLLLFGLITGVIGAVLQAQRIHIGQFWVPTGFVLALAVLIPISRAAAWWLRSRLGAVYFSVGWLIGTLAMGTSTPWGDLVLDAGIRQMAYLLIGSLLLAVAATMPLSDSQSGPNSDFETLAAISDNEPDYTGHDFTDPRGTRPGRAGSATSSAADHPDV